MRIQRRRSTRPSPAIVRGAAAIALATAVLAPLTQGCGHDYARGRSPAMLADSGPADPPPPADEPSAPAAKGRAQLWNENCPRCHNARPASFYTLRQWEVAMHHMRVRCPLTAEEHKKIMEFFAASK